MEPIVLLLFCAVLIGCVCCSVSIIVALTIGLLLFIGYALVRGFRPGAVLSMCLSGVRTVGGILTCFLLIGVLTALWRASGCIPTIVSYASDLIRPQTLVPLTFLLNALVSVLTGTAFGTAATMGVICVSIARAMGLPLFWVGGAMLSGVFFGDRCSPVSTGALLVSTITETDIYRNLRGMLSSAAIPFALSCVIYTIVGLLLPCGAEETDVRAIFASEFTIAPICLLPAAVILLLALLRVRVRPLLLCSCAVALPIALTVQGQPVGLTLRRLVYGYRCSSPALSAMLDGGGLLSMLRVSAIVLIASCYAGILRETRLTGFLKQPIHRLYDRLGYYPAVLTVSVCVSAIACNQTLAIMLTDRLTAELQPECEPRALALEDSAVVIAPLIPWSIAGSVPLASVGAPLLCIAAACYLYLLPLWRLTTALHARRSASPTDQRKP